MKKDVFGVAGFSLRKITVFYRILKCATLIFGLMVCLSNSLFALPKGFVDVTKNMTAIYDIRYSNHQNFTGVPVPGYKAEKCILTNEAFAALQKVHDEAEKLGLKLHIYDCYRPQMAVDFFVKWTEDPKETRMKVNYYPNLQKSDLIPQGYIAAKSSHSRGSTVDLSIEKLDMGTRFDFFGEESHTYYPNLSEKARANRLLLKELMENNGFKGIDEEWWHFTLAKEPFPNQYFNFPVE